jgi:hypothetical protein
MCRTAALGCAGGMHWFWRSVLYVALGMFVLSVIASLGSAYANRDCDINSMDCDLGPIYGMLWAMFALPGYLVLVVLIEARLGARRRQRARERERS